MTTLRTTQAAPETQTRCRKPVIPPAALEVPPEAVRLKTRAVAAPAYRHHRFPESGSLKNARRDHQPIARPPHLTEGAVPAR